MVLSTVQSMSIHTHTHAIKRSKEADAAASRFHKPHLARQRSVANADKQAPKLYMPEIYGEWQREGIRGGVVPSVQEVGSGEPGGGYAPPRKKCKLHAEKVKFCALLLFQHEITVDSKLVGDLVQAPGAGRLTPVSGRLPGIPGDLGRLLTNDAVQYKQLPRQHTAAN